MLAHDITFNRFLYISKYSLYLRSTKFCRTLLSNYQDCTVAGSNYPASTTLQRVARNGLGRESIGESAPTTHRPLSCNKPKQCLPKSPIRRASKKKKLWRKSLDLKHAALALSWLPNARPAIKAKKERQRKVVLSVVGKTHISKMVHA